MRIGIIGSGNIGVQPRGFRTSEARSRANQLRGGKGLEALVAELGRNAKATTIEEAARFGNLVLIAIPFSRIKNTACGPRTAVVFGVFELEVSLKGDGYSSL